MKANEAPKTLYIDANDNLNDTWFNAFIAPNSKGKDIEYIRTDAFIDKIDNFLNEKYMIKTKEPLRWVPIRQVVEDFKNYMKR